MHNKYDVILVLGRGVNKNGSLPEGAKARVEKAVELYNKKTAKYILFSGKWSYKSEFIFPVTEAQAMANYAQTLGIPKKHILMEQKSVDTLTNLLFAKKILQQHNWHSICIVSSINHTKRIQYLEQKILGPQYSVDIINCKNTLSKSKLQKSMEREEKSLSIKKQYLESDQLKDGDDSAIWQIVKKIHPAFSKHPKFTKEELMHMMGESKADYR